MSITIRARYFFWLLGLGLLVATAAGAGWVLNRSSADEGGTPSPAREPDTQGANTITCLGFVDVETKVADLYPVQPGRVVWVIDENKDVRKGEVLLRLDDRIPKLRVDQAKAGLDEAQARLTLAKQGTKAKEYKIEQQKAAVGAVEHELKSAQEQAKIKEDQFKSKLINLNEKLVFDQMVKKVQALVEVERAKLNELELLRPQLAIDRTKAEVAGKHALYEEAKLALQECELNAPSDGTVLRVLAGIGEVLGSNPRAPALQFAPKVARVIRAEVLQEFANKVKVGQEVTVADDTTHGPRWQGRVKQVGDWFSQRRHIIQEPFQYNDVRTLECLVHITAQENQPLRIGQRVRVTIKQGGP